MGITVEDIQDQHQFEELIQGLIDNKYGCCSDFVVPSTITGLSANLTILLAAGRMEAAGVGNRLAFQKDKLIRGDKVNWIEPDSTNSHEVIYLKKVWKFIDHLNRTCFASIRSLESHYSSYEQGSFYKKHVDQFKSEKGRKYSIILYLNQDWKEEDGGMLSLYPIGAEQKQISPVGGRLVFFRSDEMEHEVHPSLTRERRSIAGWLKN